jgi:hypothetical protein
LGKDTLNERLSCLNTTGIPHEEIPLYTNPKSFVAASGAGHDKAKIVVPFTKVENSIDTAIGGSNYGA